MLNEGLIWNLYPRFIIYHLEFITPGPFGRFCHLSLKMNNLVTLN